MLALFITVASAVDHFPDVPVVASTSERKGTQLADYFSLDHLQKKSAEARALKKWVESLAKGENITVNMKKIYNLGRDGNPDAAFIVGTIFEYGLFGQPMNDTEARRFYEIGASQKHVQSQSALSFLLFNGYGGEKDEVRALDLAERADAHGSISSKLFLATLNHIRTSDHSETFRMLDSVAAKAIRNLPYLRRTANGGVKLLDKNLPKRNEATEEANEEFSNRLIEAGDILERFHRAIKELNAVDPNYTKAEELLNSTLPYYKPSFGVLAAMQMDNHGNYNEPLKLLMLAANYNDTTAKAIIAQMLLSNDHASPEALRQSEELLRQSALENNTIALYEYAKRSLEARRFFNGTRDEAADMLRESENAGYLPAIYENTKQMVREHGADEMAVKRHLNLLENMPFFDIAKRAYEAVERGNFRYALRVYEHLASWGSEGAMWNALVLREALGLDTEEFFRLLLLMNNSAALYLQGLQTSSQGESDTAIQLWRKGSSTDPFAAMSLGWMTLDNPEEAFFHFNHAAVLNPSMRYLACIGKVVVFVKNLPQLISDIISRDYLSPVYSFYRFRVRDIVTYTLPVLLFGILLILVLVRVSRIIGTEQ